MASQPAHSTNSASAAVVGRTEPRLWTPPLRKLTPDTSFGYDLIDFAERIGMPFDPWQQWLAIHMGELLPDGRPRFQFVLVLVARQNGKTLFCRVLTLYWMFIEQVPLIVGTSTGRDSAKRSWREVIEMAESIPLLAEELPDKHVREQTGDESFWNIHKSVYRFAAPNRRAGRGDTVHRVVLDELREHRNKDTYDAVIPAMNAVWDGQALAITNEGDTNSVVLDELRDSAQEFIETGAGDPRLALFSWSAPPGCDPMDRDALAQANPSLGIRQHIDNLIGQAIRAKAAGGETLARFRTEILCQKVALLDPAIDPELWRTAGTDTPLDLAEHRRSLALCFDVALDGTHATLTAAATVDGITHLEVVKRWQGFGCTKALRAELPSLVTKLKPRALGWYPGGPAAAVAAGLAERRGTNRWPPRRVEVAELRAEVPAICMGLADAVQAGEIRHPKDPMLDAHVAQTQKLTVGDRWVFVRRGSAPIDGTYAAAGAAHLARMLPPAPPPLTVA